MAGEWSDAEFGGLPSVAVAAHELKSPLALIRQLGLMLESEQLDEKSAQQMRRQIVQISDQALALTSDLANVANLSPSLFPLEPVNPLALCQQIALEMMPMATIYQRRIDWPKTGRNSHLVLGNRTLLARILANFLSNSLKYTEENSVIKVGLGRRGGLLRLSVRDFGPMMSLREYRQMLSEMELKKTTRMRPESSGLGIYVAAQFARAMNGKIGLIRHRDGMTFYVEVPLSRQLSLL